MGTEHLRSLQVGTAEIHKKPQATSNTSLVRKEKSYELEKGKNS